MTSMLSADILLVFPAFLMGAGFGALLFLALTPLQESWAWPAVRTGLAGSATGAVIFVATAEWWPPIVGPFVVCPVASAAVVVCQRVVTARIAERRRRTQFH
jgi:hypothetical protein